MGSGNNNINLPEGQNFAPDPERVAELEAMMLPHTYHFAEPCSNRSVWETIRRSSAGDKLLRAAREYASEDPLPYLTNEIFWYTVDKKNRDRIDPVVPSVRSRLTLLPIAECMEPDGKYLPQIEKDIQALADLDLWIHPGNNVHRVQGALADLASVHHAANCATASVILEDRLSSKTHQLIRHLLDKHIFLDFEKRILSGKDVYWWVTRTNNWNSVCLSQILTCALAMKEDPHERAWYVALTEKLITYSEQGYESSGFCSEGVGYWGYGFSHYVIASELVKAVTGGAIDWLEKPKSRRIAGFGRRMEIQKGVYPSYSDNENRDYVSQWLLHWYNNRINPHRKHRDTSQSIDPFDPKHFQFSTQLHLILFRQVDINEAYAIEDSQPNREWFEDAQFLICRPGPDSQSRLAATFKGGHNGVSHNHNDIGTFTVLLGEHELLVDPGREEYTFRTFSKQRYHSNLLNSYGHPVPVVAGALQKPGKDDYKTGVGSEYHASVQCAEFTDQQDHVSLDLTRAYRVDSLVQLLRDFHYYRNGSESVEVVDRVEFKKPEAFETALITFAEWKQNEDGSINISARGKAIRVEIETHDGELAFSHSVIEESSTPTRLAWALVQPVSNAEIRFRITPA